MLKRKGCFYYDEADDGVKSICVHRYKIHVESEQTHTFTMKSIEFSNGVSYIRLFSLFKLVSLVCINVVWVAGEIPGTSNSVYLLFCVDVQSSHVLLCINSYDNTVSRRLYPIGDKKSIEHLSLYCLLCIRGIL